ncbi:MAG: hypothetical protein DRO36_06515 [Candidatus Hecatellales archaeon]|nr:MAG: hypothetical protein DRO36_06515 [Candidatus Hecatellales archaeon]
MKLSIEEIKLDSKLESLFPKMSKEEFESLKRDMEVNGLQEPLTIAKDRTLLDGYHRFKACKSLGMKKVEVIVKDDVRTFEDKLRYAFSKNSIRRHLTAFQKVYSYLQFRKETLRSQKVSNVGHPSIRQVAKTLGLNKSTVDYCMKIINSGDEDLIKKVYENKVSLRQALKKVKQQSNKSTPKNYILSIPYELFEKYESKFSDPRKAMIETLEEGVKK